MRTLGGKRLIVIAILTIACISIGKDNHGQNSGYSDQFFLDDNKKLILIDAENMLNEDMDSAYIKINTVLDNSIKNNELSDQILARRLLGLYYYKKGDIELATEQLSQSIQIAEEYNAEMEKAISMAYLAEVYGYVGFSEKRYDLIIKSIEIFENFKDTFHLSYCYNELGELSRKLHKGKESFAYFKKTLNLSTLSGNKLVMAKANTNIGTAYINRNMLDSADKYLLTGLRIAKDIKETQEECKLFVRLGRAYLRASNYTLAVNTFYEGLRRSEETQNDLWAGRCCHFLTKSYYVMGITDSAFFYANRAIAYYKKNEDIVLARIIYSFLNEIFDYEGEVDSAYKYFKLQQSVIDTIEKRKNLVEISNIKWRYKLNEKEQEMKQLEAKKEILEEKQKAEQRARIWFWLSILGLGGLSALLFYSVRQKARLFIKEKQLRIAEKDKAKDKELLMQVEREKNLSELEHKNKELATLTMQMYSKSETMVTIRDGIEEVKQSFAKTKTDNKLSINKELRKLTIQLDSNMRMDEEWENLKYQFQEVHHGFYNKLKDVHPDLTQYDLKLCTFIHLGFDTKQIAQMLNVNHESLRKQRYRMRKKMGISTKTELGEHIAEVVY